MISRQFDLNKVLSFDELEEVYQTAMRENKEYSGYTGKVFRYIGSTGKITDRPIVIIGKYKYVLFNTNTGVQKISYSGISAYFNQVVLPKPDKSWYIPDLGEKFYYSKGNAKIQLAGKLYGYKNPISWGLPSIMSCFFASKCKEYCYAEVTNSTYLNTLRLALHNYYLVMTCNTEKLAQLFVDMYDASDTELTRIDDTGDIVNIHEFKAIILSAVKRPNVTVYMYTKSTKIVYDYLVEGGTIPNNVRINSSATDNAIAMEYAYKLQAEFNVPICHILETSEDILEWYNAGLPFNSTEKLAIANDKLDFAIALHGTFKKGTPEYLANATRLHLEETYNIETC